MEKDKELNKKRRLTFRAKLLLGVIVLLASSVAFCCTCAPIGVAAFFDFYPAPTDSAREIVAPWSVIVAYALGASRPLL